MINEFKDWFKMYPPKSASSEGWQAFEEDCKNRYPIRHWLNETLIPPIERGLGEAKDQFRYRFVQRFHIIDTKLKPGYYDSDTLMLFGMFALLKDFVEIECAWMEFISHDDSEPVPWYKWRPFKPNRELGLKYLDWEISLKDEEDGVANITQSESAQIKKELYLWWMDERPKREDPYSKIDLPESGDLNSWLKDSSPERTKLMNEIHELDEAHNNEDTEMLIKLVKVRSTLWT